MQPGLRRAAWFVGLWTAGVVTVTLISLAIRFVIV